MATKNASIFHQIRYALCAMRYAIFKYIRYTLCALPACPVGRRYAIFMVLLFLMTACATDSGSAKKDMSDIPSAEQQSVPSQSETKSEAQPEDKPAQEITNLEEKWGIRIIGVRLTAADFMLDFRYRILDADKAKSLLSRQIKPHLIDQATGKKFEVPQTKLGPMRQTAVKPQANRNYIIIFANRDKVVHRGSKVTVVVGEFVVENLVVE